jgi:hypothetical protein
MNSTTYEHLPPYIWIPATIIGLAVWGWMIFCNFGVEKKAKNK